MKGFENRRRKEPPNVRTRDLSLIGTQVTQERLLSAKDGLLVLTCRRPPNYSLMQLVERTLTGSQNEAGGL